MSQRDDSRPWVAKADVMTAHEFVDLLSPVSGIFGSERGLPHKLLFRGVGTFFIRLFRLHFGRAQNFSCRLTTQLGQVKQIDNRLNAN
jgi:hypothetical protein